MESLQIKKEILDKAWNIFVTNGNIQSTVRPVIAESWLRCKQLEINPYIFRLQKMDHKIIESELSANRDLIATSLSIMKNLFNFVEGTGFLISLANNKGMILEVVGEYKVIRKAGVQIGHLWTEESAGTNAIGLCLITKKPIQVYASEHFLKSTHDWTCSSAPIFDENQNLIGILTMTGECNKVHLHTLGMVAAGVYAIENSLRMQKSINKMAISDAYKTAIMESIDEGILALNTDGTIIHINATTKRILKIDRPVEEIISKPVAQVIGLNHPITVRIQNCFKKRSSEETFFIDEGSITVTNKIIKSLDNNVIGLVLVLREMKTMKNLLNRMVGARATLTFKDLIGQNELFLSAVNLARAASNSVSNVLLLGESGTGKEIFAQAIHNASQRKSGPFLGINCAALPRGLIESELFGYAEGAFTGAKKGGNPGKFELADGGTLFLDEIGEMPLELQAILLRVLQESSIVRIGGKEIIPVDVRIIAATNKDLLKEVKMGSFRRDLYYRLNVLTINIPPLRERTDDISTLAVHFLNVLNRRLNKDVKWISRKVFDIFSNYHWPGNVRELQNVMERAINITHGSTVFPSSLPDYMLNARENGNKSGYFRKVPLKEYEKQLIVSLLEEHKGNRAKVAKNLGVSRTTLYRKLDEYNIQ